jgi:hypothetical protein
MKKALLLLTIILTAGFSVFAQNLTLSYTSGPIANGATMTIVGDTGSTLFSHVWVTNNSSTMSVKCKKKHISVINGSENTICWGGACWADTSLYIIPDPTVIPAGDTNKIDFVGDYRANGHSGVSTIRYTFYNMNQVNDSVCFLVAYDATVGINEINPLKVSDIYPNPADNAAFLNYNIISVFTNAEIRVIDLLGNKVQIIPVYEKEGRIKISTENLTSGIYFYSVLIDGKTVFTKKLVVRHK